MLGHYAHFISCFYFHSTGQIAGGDGGALTLHVGTKEGSWHLPRKGDGHITLTYTLLLGTQALSALHLALTLTKEEKDA